MASIELLYYQEIRAYKRLSLDEEKSLIERMHAGDMSARECLIQSYLHLVVSMAKHPRWHNQAELLDLIQEGNIGLIQAVDTYEPSADNSLAGFATICIRHKLLNFVRKRYDELLVLDTPVFEDSEEYITQADMLIDEATVLGDASFANAEEEMMVDERRSHLLYALKSLTRREREVLELLYGIGVQEALSVQEVSLLLGISSPRICQIRDEALMRLMG
jgi:RNA polymerase sigma factor (sigma-70 family)